MTTASLLVELFTEELPPKALKRLGDVFATTLRDGLATRGFLEPSSTLAAFATPRRLAVVITAVRAVAPDAEVTQKLMPAKVALDAAGNVSQAFAKKLAALGRPALATATLAAVDGSDRVHVESDGKADYVFLTSLAAGAPLAGGLQLAFDAALAALPIPKMMSYAGPGSYYNDEKFVRPAHRLTALHGADVVPIAALGLTAGRSVAGHRFLSRPDITIATADAYAPTLEAEGKVQPSFAARRAAIVTALAAAAGTLTPIMPDALLDEVTALVEWPAVYRGTFDTAFLDVPRETLILTMQHNQKYFALADATGALTNHFLVVSNLPTAKPAAIIGGNERVLRARLADAKFFYDFDRRQPLAARVDKLASVVFHNKLGTQGERGERLRALATTLAPLVGADVAQADRAALLAKADLVTDMVGEFPELQGTMGRYYALHDGEPPAVADAIAQHYAPRFAGDVLPVGPVAQAVALADKLELLAGLFGIGQVPTGDRDPFGLRRAALGVIRILIEKRIRVPLPTLVENAFAAFANVPAVQGSLVDLTAFITERLRGYLRELGYTTNEIASVVDASPSELYLIPEQLAAIRAFTALPEAPALAAANKRIVNLLAKNGRFVSMGRFAPGVVLPEMLEPGAETDLATALAALTPIVDAKCAAGDYTGALVALASIRGAVDRFFDDVMVMADDPAVRDNRLNLLYNVAGTMNRVANIGKLA